LRRIDGGVTLGLRLSEGGNGRDCLTGGRCQEKREREKMRGGGQHRNFQGGGGRRTRSLRSLKGYEVLGFVRDFPKALLSVKNDFRHADSPRKGRREGVRVVGAENGSGKGVYQIV